MRPGLDRNPNLEPNTPWELENHDAELLAEFNTGSEVTASELIQIHRMAVEARILGGIIDQNPKRDWQPANCWKWASAKEKLTKTKNAAMAAKRASFHRTFTVVSYSLHNSRLSSVTTMKLKSPFLSPKLAALTMSAAAVLLLSWQASAQSPPSKTATTWQDLGFTQIPEGLSTDLIPLFEGLNEARGTWSFEGETAGDGAAEVLKGSLHIQGNPSAGMVPIWQMALGWPGDDPGHSMIFNIMAGPSEGGFDLMLIRIGPVKKPGADDAKPEVQRTPFQGTWNLESRTITWAERDLPAGLPGQAAEEDPPKPKQSFDMVVAADGKILIRNSKHTPQGQVVSAKAVVRTGEAPAEPVTLTGKHSFKTVAEIADSRIKPWLPLQATDISLLSERNGHFARYKVEKDHFMKFLNGLWEADEGSSAHKRDEMHGEGEPASRERMVRRFKAAGWEPLGKALVYYSPSKGSGAMTTYYYDREAGIAYHDRGYW